MLAEVRDNITLLDEARLLVNLDKPASVDIANPDIHQDWRQRTYTVVSYRMASEAVKMYRTLSDLLLKVPENVRQDYREIFCWLGYAALPEFSSVELEQYFREQPLSLVFQDEDYNNLIDRIKERLSNELLLEDRNVLRERMYNALHKNETTLSEKTTRANTRGTIAQWLALYDGAVGTGINETLARLEFENNAATTARLSDVERLALKQLLNFYEFIKISSFDPAGFEEDIVVERDGKLYLLTNGVFIDIAARVSGADTKSPAAHPADTSTPTSITIPPQREIVAAANELLAKTDGEVNKVLQALNRNLDERDVRASLGALLLLAELRKLDDALEEGSFARTLVEDDLRANNQQSQLEGLRINPTAPQYIARFLKTALEGKLGLQRSDALQVAERLGKVLAFEGEKYSKLVTADASGERKWNI